MSDDNPSRMEIYDAIDRLERSLKNYLDQGFNGLNQRMDVANGRTTKNETSINALEVQVGILLDRTNSTKKAVNSSRGQIKWVPWISSGTIIALVEAIRIFFQ